MMTAQAFPPVAKRAHRRMASAALHADSSLKTRLSRYQHHINQARALEAADGAV
jgi:hypothetical protein